MHAYINTHTYIYTHIHTNKYTYTNSHIHTYIPTHTHTHTYIHTFIQVEGVLSSAEKQPEHINNNQPIPITLEEIQCTVARRKEDK